MNSIYHAYLAYERRVERGELNIDSMKASKRSGRREPLLEQVGNLLIITGQRLKRQHTAGKPMAWTSLTGSKP